MPFSSHSVSTHLPPTQADGAQSHGRDDLTYQLVTVATMLLLLASLWVF